MMGIAVDFVPSAPPRAKWLRPLGRRVAMLGVAAIAWGSWLGGAAAELPLVRVAVKPIPPFVYTDKPIPRGFSIDLWNEIAEVIGVRTEFVVEETVQDLLALAEEGRVDAAIAAVTINSDREALVDFSHPYYRSGLRIGVPLRHGPTLFNTIGRFLSLDLLAMLAMLTTLTLVAAHLLWLIERGVNPECFPARYVSGVGEALWW
jgi:polar amino acid transport system substrate-binding protein